MRLTRSLRALLILTGISLTSRAAMAQRSWHDEQGRSAYRLDLSLPFLTDSLSPGKKFYSGGMVASFSLRAGEGFRVEGDIPMMRAGYDFGGTTGSLSAFRLGNPYLGLRIGEDDKLITAFLGVRGPLNGTPDTEIGERAVGSGIATGLAGYEAFASKLLTIRSGLETHHVKPNGMLVGFRVGPTILINTSNDPRAEGEIFLDWGGRFGYEGAKALATVALNGRYLLTAPFYSFDCVDQGFPAGCDPKSFDARTYHSMSFTLELRQGRYRPRANFEFPFDQALKAVSKASLTFGLSIAK